MSGIWPDVWDLVRCLGFGQVSVIWQDVWDLARSLVLSLNMAQNYTRDSVGVIV